MKKIAMLAAMLLGCDTHPMTVTADVQPVPAVDVCCVYYEATSTWQTCWGCGNVVYCVGVPCIEGIPSCQEGNPRGPGQGAASYPVGGVACPQ